MFRISHVMGTHREHDRRCLDEIQELFRAAFPELAEDGEYITRKLDEQAARGYPCILLAAHGPGDRIVGFALADFFESIGYAYLDFIVTQAELRGRGLGGALYEALREDLEARGARGLFLEVPTDDPEQVPNPAHLKANKSRLKFYERYGARPILGTLYDQPIRPGKPPEPRLLYDPLEIDRPLEAAELRKVIKSILTLRYNYADNDAYVRKVVASVVDDPVRIRRSTYVGPGEKRFKVPRRLHPLKVFCSSRHALHHVRERGYVERPARVDVILKALAELPDVERLPVRNFGEGPIRAVHDADFVNYLRNVCQDLPDGEMVYPYVFPIRRIDRPPHDRSIRAGYYCIDTFTPLSRDAYKAARAAVNVALSGAEAILEGHPLVYSLCRPPGHHAERDTYGGFCYFCNGAIAAEYLSGRLGGRIAILDVDYHHGNGSQDIFYNRSDVLTVSIHGHPSFAYPYFSGFADETGEGEGEGFNVNLPLPEHVHDARYLEELDEAIKLVRLYKPEALVVSLGLDIAKADPTGTWSVTPDGLFEVGRRIGVLKLPTLLVQEGGYNIRSLGRNAARMLAGVCAGALNRRKRPRS
ncbi:MAG TPA: histone deacetylase family protein [Isosphaeraceae bacterium]|jgi:acetoin utilization deacetylase AcuC-like enzyme/ribosomal protein S18 acetylase RimI-like enzyme|nr:histone deacetylase family protein [Isosphaeraceae bacterium]